MIYYKSSVNYGYYYSLNNYLSAYCVYALEAEDITVKKTEMVAAFMEFIIK